MDSLRNTEEEEPMFLGGFFDKNDPPLLHADLAQVHEVQDEEKMVMVDPSQKDYWVGVV